MATYTSLFSAIIFFFSRILNLHYKTPRYLHRKVSNVLNSPHIKLQKYPSFVKSHDYYFNFDDDQTLIFNVEETLLKSSSMFDFFMLVAFEAGSPLRALILLVLYPIICSVSKEMGIKIMVFVSFFGIKQKSFMVGKGVLPKFLLEDVGFEGFQVVKKCNKKVGVSDLPQVMIESFLKDYLEINYIVGKELKVINGRFIGLMEDKKRHMNNLKDILGEDDYEMMSSNVVGICGSRTSLSHPLFSFCKEIYLTSEAIKKKWQYLPRENYPKPLIFHDGRLSLKPTPTNTLTLFLWLPFATLLSLFRVFISKTVPLKLATPILAFTGLKLLVLSPASNPTKHGTPPKTRSSSNGQGTLYVCNHKTLLDPLYLSFALSKPLTAVTYSLSRMSEILAPIRTVRLTRDRDQDGKMMENLLSQGDLVVCPEGTTCREPFLLRFSPLFTEMSDHIVPVAMECNVSMFYGTTASGLKCLDPIFFLMNPRPSYTVQLLNPADGASASACRESSRSRFDVANRVQEEIGEALSFQCTTLTRKDKYLILAGNHGVV